MGRRRQKVDRKFLVFFSNNANIYFDCDVFIIFVRDRNVICGFFRKAGVYACLMFSIVEMRGRFLEVLNADKVLVSNYLIGTLTILSILASVGAAINQAQMDRP